MQIKRRTFALGLLCAALIAGFSCGFWQHLYLSLVWATQDWQRAFHDDVADKLRLIKETHSWAASAGLAFIGFAYGAIHAIGPGHGKVVVSSYLLASQSSLKRGLVITFLSAMMQACVAVLLVVGLTALLGLSDRQAQQATATFETLSFALIGVIGIVLIWRGARVLLPVHHGHKHEHHEHGCSCGCCCHGHAPDPARIDRAEGWPALAALVFSIGLRPCSGALLLLLFADLVGALGAGIAACFAMALGTALTTGLLAVLTVRSKDLALRLTGWAGESGRRAQAWLAVIGGSLILVLAVAFAQGGLTSSDTAAATQNHPLMKGLSQTAH